MKSVPTLLSALALVLAVAPGPAGAQDAIPQPPLITESDALDAFLWVARPLVVFADTPNDPRFIQQIELLQDRQADLIERDVVVLVDTDPDAGSALRKTLRPRGFMLALIGKDGEVKLRKPAPWNVRELTRVIDKMPLRRQELRDAKRAAGAG